MREKLLLFIATTFISINAQTFVKFNDPNSPINTATYPSNYSGVAWVDIDGDGDLDIHATNSLTFRNDGNDNFSLIETAIGSNQSSQNSNGVSWADYDNDGDIDCFLTGNPSTLYRNMGNWNFEVFQAGELASSVPIRGWACAWSDYDRNGFVDLVITHPAGFLGAATPSFLLNNLGAGNLVFTNEGYEFTNSRAPYTVATWYDYDLDGDEDLFIGSGPAGTGARDYLYRNLLAQTGTATLERIDDENIGTDLQDGQVWNWIDYDNDGDLDGMLTNYGGALNKFYENQNGQLILIENALTKSGRYLANSWADYDNDGDLDVILTADSGNEFFVNNGNGEFQLVPNAIPKTPRSSGAVWGDYDNDGDLDLFMVSGTKGLFKNETVNSNNWINISLKGTLSNFSAIGAKVRAKATFSGKEQWQIRTVSAQNSFNSQNSLRVHFGFGEAEIIDSVIIDWPSGQQTTLTNVQTKQFLSITEDIPQNYISANISADSTSAVDKESLTVQFKDIGFTDPASPITSWKWDLDNDGVIDSEEQNPTFTYNSRGKYSVKLTVSNGVNEDSKTFENFIRITGYLPELFLTSSLKTLGNINSDQPAFNDTFYVYNLGKGMDSVDVSINPTNVVSDSALSVSPSSFIIQPGDSVQIQTSFYPGNFNQFNVTLRPEVILQSNFSLGGTSLSRGYVLRIRLATDVENNATIPASFNLSQNYPNPFNPSTKIEYDLPTSEFTSIKVYDILGNLIGTLANEQQTAGRHTLEFDARNLPSGVYLYKISAGTFNQTKKMILLK